MAKQSEAMEILFHEVSCYLTSAGQILNKEWTFKIFQCEWLNKKTVQVEREIHRSKFSLTSSFKKFSFSI